MTDFQDHLRAQGSYYSRKKEKQRIEKLLGRTPEPEEWLIEKPDGLYIDDVKIVGYLQGERADQAIRRLFN